MWPFTKKEKLISNKAPYHYFAVYNTIMDIAKKRGKIYDHISLKRLVFLIYCIYYGGDKKPLIYESFYILTPGIINTDSIFDYEIHNINYNKLITKHIGKEYELTIDSNCDDYKKIEEIYDVYGSFTDTELYVKIMNSEIELKDGTTLYCPSKKTLLENGFEDYYNSLNNKNSHKDKAYRKKLLCDIYESNLYIDNKYVCEYYSHFFDDNDENKDIKE